MNVIILAIVVVVIIGNIIIISKWFKMLANVNEIRKILSKTNGDTYEDLIYKSLSGCLNFDEALRRAIYVDLVGVRNLRDEDMDFNRIGGRMAYYRAHYVIWKMRCEKQGWNFPAMYDGLDELEKFEERLLDTTTPTIDTIQKKDDVKFF